VVAGANRFKVKGREVSVSRGAGVSVCVSGTCYDMPRPETAEGRRYLSTIRCALRTNPAKVVEEFNDFAVPSGAGRKRLSEIPEVSVHLCKPYRPGRKAKRRR